MFNPEELKLMNRLVVALETIAGALDPAQPKAENQVAHSLAGIKSSLEMCGAGERHRPQLHSRSVRERSLPAGRKFGVEFRPKIKSGASLWRALDSSIPCCPIISNWGFSFLQTPFSFDLTLSRPEETPVSLLPYAGISDVSCISRW